MENLDGLNNKQPTGQGKFTDGAVTQHVDNDILGTKGLEETEKMFEEIRRLPLVVEKSQKELSQMQGNIIQLRQKLAQKQEQVQMMAKTMENDRSLVEQIRKEKHDLVKDKEKIETELINCKGRLSRYLGNTLTENNPGIADLSNENRPNKLGERFSELYDNQWTDAFEDLDKSNPNNEQANVELLLDILMGANTLCKEISEKQHADLRKIAYLKPLMEAGSLETVLELNKQLKEFRRYTANLALDAVQEMYTDRMKNNRMMKHLNKYNSERLTSYIKECVEICWLMNVQEPPVVLAPVPEVLSGINLDLYRHYMRSGLCVEFLVWPAMLLHEGGPTIMKGVVQGCAADTVIHPKSNVSLKALDDGGDCGKPIVDSATVKEADTNSNEKQSSRIIDDQSTQHGNIHSDLPTEFKSTGKTKKKKKKKKNSKQPQTENRESTTEKNAEIDDDASFCGNVQRGVNATNGKQVATGSDVAIKLKDNQTEMNSIGTFSADRSAQYEVCLEARATSLESKIESEEDSEQSQQHSGSKSKGPSTARKESTQCPTNACDVIPSTNSGKSKSKHTNPTYAGQTQQDTTSVDGKTKKKNKNRR